MTKEELKALGLTDEQVTKISEDYGKNYVAKSKIKEKNEAPDKNCKKIYKPASTVLEPQYDTLCTDFY